MARKSCFYSWIKMEYESAHNFDALFFGFGSSLQWI
jgi:hypothetical protein